MEKDVDLKMVVVDQSADMEYRALSYAWSDAPRYARNKTIRIHGASGIEHHKVTPNLFYALIQLADTYPSGSLFWIDAICIKQSDEEERKEIVQDMDSIYHNACEVVIWLGKANEASKEIVKMVETIASISDDSFSEAWITEPMQLSSLGGKSLPKSSDPLWRDYLAFYERQWFHRGWVIQEVVLAKSALALCGRFKVSWDSLHAGSRVFLLGTLRRTFFAQFTKSRHVACEAVGRNAHRIRLIQDYIREKDPKEVLILEISTGTREPETAEYLLLHLMRMARDFKWSDERDRVYSLIGIVKMCARRWGFADLSILPDYNASTTAASVLAQVTRRIIEQSGKTGIIAQVSDLKYRKLPGLKSFVPTFNRGANYSSGRTLAFHADQNARIGSASAYKFTNDTLEVLGRRIGGYDAVERLKLGRGSDITKLRSLARRSCMPVDHDRDVTLWRVLTCDDTINGTASQDRPAAEPLEVSWSWYQEWIAEAEAKRAKVGAQRLSHLKRNLNLYSLVPSSQRQHVGQAFGNLGCLMARNLPSATARQPNS